MQSAHPGNEPDSVNSGALSVVLGIVAVSTFVIALIVTALVRDEVHAVTAVRDVTQDAAFRQLKSSQLGALEASAQYKDRTQGVVSLPIGRAMALTLEAVRRDPMSLSPWTSLPNAAPLEAAPVDAAATEPAGSDGAAGGNEAAPAAVPASPTEQTIDALPQQTPAPVQVSAEGNRGSTPAKPAPNPGALEGVPGAKPAPSTDHH